MGMGRRGVRFLENRRELRLPGLLYADNLVQCVELEEDLRVIVGGYAEVCRRRGLKINAGKSMVMVLNGEERLECEVHVDGICLEYVSELKYLGCVLDKSSTDGEECSKRVASGRRIALSIRSLVNIRDLQHDCA